jgi:amino acid transporter
VAWNRSGAGALPRHSCLLCGDGEVVPGTGSSYYFAEQSFLNHAKVWRLARLSEFIVGWGSHLYYWIYPGVMVAVMGVLCGYLVGTIWPNSMSVSTPGPAFMALIAILFSFAIAYIAQRGVNGSTSVNIAINVIQISALLVFSVLALGYRMNHAPGAWRFNSIPLQARRTPTSSRRPKLWRTAKAQTLLFAMRMGCRNPNWTLRARWFLSISPIRRKTTKEFS